MQTVQSQVKLNLPLPLKQLMEIRARRFGIPLASYIRHLVIKDIEDTEYPTFTASPIVEKAYKKAIRSEKQNKLIWIDDLDKHFDSL